MRTLTLAMLLLMAGCQGRTTTPPGKQIADAHGLREWRSQRVLIGAIHVEFRDPPAPQFDSRITYDIRTGRSRLQVTDWTILVWDGANVWLSPTDSKWPDPRTTLGTWPLLVTLPMRLADPGVEVSNEQKRRIAGRDYLLYDAAIYDMGESHRLRLAVEPGNRRVTHVLLPEAWARRVNPGFDFPIAVSFYDYSEVSDVIVPRIWRLWRWDEKDGIIGRPLGEASVYNLDFTEPKPDAFVRPGK